MKRTLRSKKYSRRIAATAGAVASGLLAPHAADAAVIRVTGSPISLGIGVVGASVSWDVDGVGGPEFEIFEGLPFFPYFRSLSLASRTSGGVQLNGYGLVGTSTATDDVQALMASFNVGPTLASGFEWGLAPNYRYRNLLQYDYATSAFKIGFDFAPHGFAEGDNLFGFRFGPSAANLQYGWGVINFDTTNGVVTIKEWSYETAANTAIHVDPIPEPSSLALLGAGAAGLLLWRSRRRKES